MLDISPVLLLSSGIVFLLVLARLNSCLFKPLLKHMDERAESIKKDLANAKGNSTDVEAILTEGNDTIAKAKSDATAIRDKVMSEAKEIAQIKLNDAKSDIEAKYDEFAKGLKQESEALRVSLSAQMPLFQESLKAKVSSI